MERRFELKISLDEEVCNHFNIDIQTPFIAYRNHIAQAQGESQTANAAEQQPAMQKM